MDMHYDRLIQERAVLGGEETFAGARILSVLALNVLTELNVTAKTSSWILVALSTFGTLFAFRRMLISSSGLSLSRATLLASGILIPMTWNYAIISRLIFPEDLPALLLFTLGLAFLFEKRAIAFHVVFILAILNRESSIFLLPAMFLIQLGRRRLLRLVLHISVLALTWFGLKLLLMHFFGGGISGPQYLNTFSQNLALIKSLVDLDHRALLLLLMFGGLWLVIPFCYGKVPNRIMLLTLMVPVFFGVMTYVGNLNREFRVFTEMIPVVAAPPLILFGKYLDRLGDTISPG